MLGIHNGYEKRDTVKNTQKLQTRQARPSFAHLSACKSMLRCTQSVLETHENYKNTMDYTTLATQETIDATMQALVSHGFKVSIVDTKEQALEAIKRMIPAGASVMNGSSVTLEQIGFVDYLASGAHSWNNLHAAVLAEKDQAKQAMLRKQAVLSDWYLGSAHAVSKSGELVLGSNSGSQLPHIMYTSPHVLLVVSTKKIVPTLRDAIERLESYVVPLEDKHMHEKYNIATALNKEVIFRGENQKSGRDVNILFVKKPLGF